MYIILKLKSIFKSITKERRKKALKIVMISFILTIAIFIIKYKTISEAKTKQEIQIAEQVEQIPVEKPKEVEMYKFYAVTLNGKNKAYVKTLEEAENIVNKIKKKYKGDGLKLDLSIDEKYTEDLEDIKADKIEVAESSMKKEINKLLDEKEKKEAIATIKGINLAMVPVKGRITSRFGAISSIRSGAHTGLDIACSSGTSIKAVAKGKVIFAKRNGAYGNLVKIDHGNGVQTWYAHCSKIYTKVGAKIKSGDVIAAVGSTGNSTGPHLHLEIRIDGVAVNPQKYLYKIIK